MKEYMIDIQNLMSMKNLYLNIGDKCRSSISKCCIKLNKSRTSSNFSVSILATARNA